MLILLLSWYTCWIRMFLLLLALVVIAIKKILYAGYQLHSCCLLYLMSMIVIILIILLLQWLLLWIWCVDFSFKFSVVSFLWKDPFPFLFFLFFLSSVIVVVDFIVVILRAVATIVSLCHCHEFGKRMIMYYIIHSTLTTNLCYLNCKG